MIDSLVEEDVHGLGSELSEDGEDDGSEVGWEKGWPVVLWCIYPTEEEVIVAVWGALLGEEVLLSSSLIELGSNVFSQWQVGDVEVGVLGILEPVTELVSLDIVYGPVPCVLRFHDVQFPIKS